MIRRRRAGDDERRFAASIPVGGSETKRRDHHQKTPLRRKGRSFKGSRRPIGGFTVPIMGDEGRKGIGLGRLETDRTTDGFLPMMPGDEADLSRP